MDDDFVQRKVQYSTGDIYEGSWNSEGKRHGIGKLITTAGSEYHGEFVKGFFHGQGVLSFSDGSKYEGTFDCGRYHGYGVYVGAHQMKYEVSDVIMHIGILVFKGVTRILSLRRQSQLSTHNARHCVPYLHLAT